MREETKRKTTRVEKCLGETGSLLQGDKQNRVPVLREGEQTPLPSSWWPCEQTRLQGAQGKREALCRYSMSLQLPYMLCHMG